MSFEKAPGDAIYICVRCGHENRAADLKMIGFKCTNCGFTVLKKARTEVVRFVKTD